MREKTIGCNVEIKAANILGIKIKPSKAYIANVTKKTALDCIKRNNLKVDEAVLKTIGMEVAIIYDKKNGKEGYFLLLPKDVGTEKSISINKGNGIDNLYAIRVFANLYL